MIPSLLPVVRRSLRTEPGPSLPGGAATVALSVLLLLLVAGVFPLGAPGVGGAAAQPEVLNDSTPTPTETPTPTPTATPTETETPTATPTPTSSDGGGGSRGDGDGSHERYPEYYSSVEPRDPDDPGRTVYTAEDGSEIDSEEAERRFHEYVNRIREEHGLEPLAHDATIATVARAHSWDMYERGFFGHRNPDGEGPSDRYGDVGGDCRSFGENLHWHDVRSSMDDGEDSAEFAVESLMDSTEHRENILSGRWTTQGIGIVLTPDGRAFVTQNFCARESSGDRSTARATPRPQEDEEDEDEDPAVDVPFESLPWVEIWSAVDAPADPDEPVPEESLQSALVEVVDAIDSGREADSYVDRAVDVGFLSRADGASLELSDPPAATPTVTRTPSPTPTRTSTPTLTRTRTSTPVESPTETSRESAATPTGTAGDAPGFGVVGVVLSVFLATALARRER